MKRIFKITLSLFLTFMIFSCSEENIENIQDEKVNLKFESNITNTKSAKNSLSITEIETEVEYVNGLPKLTSNELVEIEVTNSETDEITYAYVLKSDYELQTKNKIIQSKSSGCEFSIEGGYGFTGRCFEYGHFYTGTDCNVLFVPCDFNCIGFDDVCPGYNEGFA